MLSGPFFSGADVQKACQPGMRSSISRSIFWAYRQQAPRLNPLRLLAEDVLEESVLLVLLLFEQALHDPSATPIRSKHSKGKLSKLSKLGKQGNRRVK